MMRLARKAALLVAFSCSPRPRRPTPSARECCGAHQAASLAVGAWEEAKDERLHAFAHGTPTCERDRT
jgi:hypothetical protein